MNLNLQSKCLECEKLHERINYLEKENIEFKSLLKSITDKYIKKCNKEEEQAKEENNNILNELKLEECSKKILLLEKDIQQYHIKNKDNDSDSSERQIRMLKDKIDSINKTIVKEQHFLS